MNEQSNYGKILTTNGQKRKTRLGASFPQACASKHDVIDRNARHIFCAPPQSTLSMVRSGGGSQRGPPFSILVAPDACNGLCKMCHPNVAKGDRVLMKSLLTNAT